MPFPLSPVDAILQQASLKYKNPDRMKRDVKAALEHYQGLKLKFEDFVFNNGTTMKLLNLDGVIPVTFNNVRYNIPVIIWLLDTHPNNPPMCFVKPTSDMHIKPSRHVDLNGKIYLPFLHDWNPSMSDLFGLIQVMIVVFGEEPPVYSKPKSSQPTQPQPPVAGLPYPNSTPGYYPMPGVPGQGLAYPPYPSGTAGIPPPYPSLFPTSQPPASQPTYPPYPISNPSTSTPYPVSTQAQATPASLGMNAGNTGTIKEAHIKASLLSAVEEKVMRRVAQIEAQYQDEMKVLHQTQMDLNNGKTKLEELMKRLEFEEVELDRNINMLKEKEEELDGILGKSEKQEEIDVDEAVTPTTPLYRQLFNLYAEENATQDAIYYLGEARRRGIIDIEVFLKHVRSLSRQQFRCRALMQKCREKAGLAG